MLRAAVYGYGNIGRFTLEALLASPDFFSVLSVVSRSLPAGSLGDIPVVRSIEELSGVDVAVLCSPSRAVPGFGCRSAVERNLYGGQLRYSHGGMGCSPEIDAVAKAHQTSCIMSAGWDPGTDSMVRALLEAMAPEGLTYTNFGPGMSMGHTVAVKAVEGVKTLCP